MKQYLFAQEIDTDELISAKLLAHKEEIQSILGTHADGVGGDGQIKIPLNRVKEIWMQISL